MIQDVIIQGPGPVGAFETCCAHSLDRNTPMPHTTVDVLCCFAAKLQARVQVPSGAVAEPCFGTVSGPGFPTLLAGKHAMLEKSMTMLKTKVDQGSLGRSRISSLGDALSIFMNTHNLPVTGQEEFFAIVSVCVPWFESGVCCCSVPGPMFVCSRCWEIPGAADTKKGFFQGAAYQHCVFFAH